MRPPVLLRRALPVAVLAICASLAPAALAAPVASAPAISAPVTECVPKAGSALTSTPWAQKRLGFQRVWPITTGAGVRVAVIDTGLDRTQPQLARIAVADPLDVIPGLSGVADCDGHGSAVTGIIAAPQQSDTPFVGVAPGVTIVPIKQTNTANDHTGTASGIAAGIRHAIDAGAKVVNISVTVARPTADLDAAVTAAQHADVLIVAAAGNDRQNNNGAAYPAAYSTTHPNVIAVAASDSKDGTGNFSETGGYIDVTAPGVGVQGPAPQSGYAKVSGTSFAAPFVTGTAALVRAAHPDLSAAEVRTRLEATADPPPASVPDPSYGYGIVNPYLAVTSLRDDALPAPTPSSAAALPAPVAAAPADRSLQHVALAAGLGLLALAVLAACGAGVVRRTRAPARRRPVPD